MSKLTKNPCKWFQIYSNYVGGLFHTSRNPVFPNLARLENETELNYLQILRPASLPASDAHSLAGNPRIPGRAEQGIKLWLYAATASGTSGRMNEALEATGSSRALNGANYVWRSNNGRDEDKRYNLSEIYKKWNQRPKIDAYKEWSRLSVFY